MKNIYTILLLILINFLGYAQDVKLVDFKPSQCIERVNPFRLRTRIVEQQLIRDTLQITVATTATCCVEFIPSIEYKIDALNLLFEETGTPCECYCCYQFTYFITGITKENFEVNLQTKTVKHSEEKYKTTPVKYYTFQGDTTGTIDKYGLRQGMWVFRKKDYLVENHYKDDLLLKYVVKNLNGAILLETISQDELLEFFTK